MSNFLFLLRSFYNYKTNKAIKKTCFFFISTHFAGSLGGFRFSQKTLKILIDRYEINIESSLYHSLHRVDLHECCTNNNISILIYFIKILAIHRKKWQARNYN